MPGALLRMHDGDQGIDLRQALSFLFLAESRHYSAGFIFALAAWAAAASAAVYLLNALFGQRIERKYTQLAGAIMFAGGWWGVYATHNTPALVTFFVVSTAGITLWQFSMWVYILATTRPGCARWAPAGPTAWATSAPGAASS
jgi:hypothetical protein